MESTEYAQWYVMRDLKRRNAKEPAYKKLQKTGIKVFVPLMEQITLQKGKKVRQEGTVLKELEFFNYYRTDFD